MENSLFPLKYRLRKTDESVEIVAWETVEKGARNENDWVSYIDAQGNEHVKEHLTLEWDFVIDSPIDKMLSGGWGSLDKLDLWEARRYELVKGMYLSDEYSGEISDYVETADAIISALKRSPEPIGEEYENIGVGEIVEAIDGHERLRKFVFTDRKDIVGYEGDSGRWGLGDKVKVYIKKYEPKKGL